MSIRMCALTALSLLASACAAPEPARGPSPPAPPAAAPPPPPPATPAPPTSAAPAPAAPAALKAPETFDLPAIDAYVARTVKDAGIVGLSLAILQDGKVVLAKGYGLRSREAAAPVDADTSFAIGSVTKEFTCAAVLLLAEEKKLSMEDKVAKYYPDLTRAKDISLADLGAHVSGYPDYYPLDFLDTRMQRPITPDELIHAYGTRPLDFEPGTRWSYSNTGFIVLGRVAEKAGGQPFGKLLEERIFKPLGMTHSSFAPRAGEGTLAQGYDSFAMGEPEAVPREPEAWGNAAAAVYSTPTDLARWDLALMDGKLLKPDSYRRMTTPRVLADGRITDYSCGLGVSHRRNNDLVLTHTGEVNGFLAYNAMVPRTKSAVVLLTNSMDGNPEAIWRTILGLVLKSGLPTIIPKITGPAAKEVARDLLHQMQAGVLDRSKLGDELNLFFTDARVREAAPRLKALGEPRSVEVKDVSERGGMEVADVAFGFEHAKATALLYRTPDGKVQEFLLRKE